MTPQFDRDTYPGEGVLCCPVCKGFYTHHYAVVAYACEEDQKAVVTAIPTNKYAVEGFNIPENPSARRDGVAVMFFCEECAARFRVTIAQHKGSTYFKAVAK